MSSLWPVIRESSVEWGTRVADGRGAVGVLASGWGRGGGAVVVDCGGAGGLADGTTTRGRIVVAACWGGVVVVLVVVLVVVAVVAVCGTATGRRGSCGWGDRWVVHDVCLAFIQK